MLSPARAWADNPDETQLEPASPPSEVQDPEQPEQPQEPEQPEQPDAADSTEAPPVRSKAEPVPGKQDPASSKAELVRAKDEERGADTAKEVEPPAEKPQATAPVVSPALVSAREALIQEATRLAQREDALTKREAALTKRETSVTQREQRVARQVAAEIAKAERSMGLDQEGRKRQSIQLAPDEVLTDLRISMLFLERTRFAIAPMRLAGEANQAYGDDRVPLIFEGTPALHIPVYNRLSELMAYGARGGYYNYIPYVSLSFVPTVRMSSGTLDVMTPSYRVGADFQWFAQRSGLGGDPDRVRVQSLRLSAYHYSNGQGGCSFVEGERDAPSREASPSRCRVAYNEAQAGQSTDWYRSHVNMRSGSFSTNYLTLAYHRRLVRLGGAPDLDGLRFEQRTLTAGVLANALIAAWNGEGQKDLYPRFNVRGELRFERVLGDSLRYPARLGLEVFAEYYFLDQKRRWHTDAYFPVRAGGEVSLTWPKANDLGLYAALSSGQDPYNIHFVYNSTWLHFGFVVDLFERPRYGSGRRALQASGDSEG